MNRLCPHCKEMKPPNHFACVGNAKGGSVRSAAKTRAARRNARQPRKSAAKP